MSEFDLASIARCFDGAIPAALATVSAAGIPNITYLSRAHAVDGERIALSNQFLSKTARNLAENPQASLLLIDPLTHDEFRLSLVYERTERRGAVFDKLREDVDAIAALTGMQDVFRLRSADIYRVLSVEQVPPNAEGVIPAVVAAAARRRAPGVGVVSELVGRLARSQDLDGLVDAVVDGLVRLGYHHVHLLLLDEEGRRLYTIASRGFDADSVGAEVVLGSGMIGVAAARCAPVRVGNLLQMAKYSRSVRRAFEERGEVQATGEVPVPGLANADSRIVVPAMALGQLVGVLVAESTLPAAFTDDDEAVLLLVASALAGAVEALRAGDGEAADDTLGAPAPAVDDPARGTGVPVITRPPEPAPSRGAATRVRFFAQDGSTFVDGEYLIKGVAGRILWALLGEHVASGRTSFTNLEVRRNPSLDMPGFKDNFESRLILLKRRLDERDAPVRIERTGRGRFRLDVAGPVVLDLADP